MPRDALELGEEAEEDGEEHHEQREEDRRKDTLYDTNHRFWKGTEPGEPVVRLAKIRNIRDDTNERNCMRQIIETCQYNPLFASERNDRSPSSHKGGRKNGTHLE